MSEIAESSYIIAITPEVKKKITELLATDHIKKGKNSSSAPITNMT